MNIKLLLIIPFMFLNACAGFQGVADDVEKMVDNDAVTVKVDKDAFSKETDVSVHIDVINKQPSQIAPEIKPQ